MAKSDYSETPLVKKLGIKEGFKLLVKNVPANYFDLIHPIPEDVHITDRASKNLDMVHGFVTKKSQLKQLIKSSFPNIKVDGMIWVSWPKKSSGVPTQVSDQDIRDLILPMGLVDVKVCSVDTTWSGLKLMIRKDQRSKLLHR